MKQGMGKEKHEMKYYAVEMSNGDVFGVPAEVIADHYAKSYEKRGEGYEENYNDMMEWFDGRGNVVSNWAQNHMGWEDVKDKAVLLYHNIREIDFEHEWWKPYEYKILEKIE